MNSYATNPNMEISHELIEDGLPYGTLDADIGYSSLSLKQKEPIIVFRDSTLNLTEDEQKLQTPSQNEEGQYFITSNQKDDGENTKTPNTEELLAKAQNFQNTKEKL